MIRPAPLGPALVCALALALYRDASAQERPKLTVPTIALSTAAAADWAATYHGIKYYHLRESNPLLQPWQQSRVKLVSVGALIDAGTIGAWNLTIGHRHPRVAAAGLWATTAFRAYLAFHNWRNERKAPRRTVAAAHR